MVHNSITLWLRWTWPKMPQSTIMSISWIPLIIQWKHNVNHGYCNFARIWKTYKSELFPVAAFDYPTNYFLSAPARHAHVVDFTMSATIRTNTLLSTSTNHPLNTSQHTIDNLIQLSVTRLKSSIVYICTKNTLQHIMRSLLGLPPVHQCHTFKT
jgi:hypothetical protein